MKRFSALISLFAAAAVILSFTACGKGTKKETPSVENGTVAGDVLATYIGDGLKTQFTSLVKLKLYEDSSKAYDFDSIDITVKEKTDEKCEFTAKVGVIDSDKTETFKCVAVKGADGWELESIK